MCRTRSRGTLGAVKRVGSLGLGEEEGSKEETKKNASLGIYAFVCCICYGNFFVPVLRERKAKYTQPEKHKT